MHRRMIFLLVFILSVIVIEVVPRIVAADINSRHLYYAVPAQAKYFSMGSQDVLADIAWVRLLQDIDRCEQSPTARTDEGVRIGKNRKAACSEGWAYHILDFIMELTPRWRLVQRVGPLMLSVVVDDRDGATKLFKKAIVNFPNDWPILMRAGYHFLYEEQDLLLSARVFEAAANQPEAPGWCRLLAGRLYQDTGRLHIAKLVLEDFLRRSTPESPGYEKAKVRLEQVYRQLAEEETKKTKSSVKK